MTGELLYAWRIEFSIECPIGFFEYARDCLYVKALTVEERAFYCHGTAEEESEKDFL
jgi:hypothetical protein